MLQLRSLLGNGTCPPENTAAQDPTTLSSFGDINLSNPHLIGWIIAGGCTLLTFIIAFTNITLHARNYRRPLQQRQIIRILLMPCVFSLASFAGYRFFREFVYFKLVRDTYEAFTIAAFLFLLLLFLSDSPLEQVELLKKEKRRMVFPLSCLHFRPSKPKFIFLVKWSVLQFVILKPLISLSSIITQALGVFCGTSQSPRFANVWLEVIDFVSVTIALYGLITLYSLISDELRGKRPLAKFSTIKIIVALVFYQNFIFTLLAHYGVLKPTEFWTAHNVADGLNALVTTFEMVLVALFQLYAFPYTEYKLMIPDDRGDSKHTSFWKSFAHSQNYSDFVIAIGESFVFFWDALRGKPYTKAVKIDKTGDQIGMGLDFQSAFSGGHDRIPLSSNVKYEDEGRTEDDAQWSNGTTKEDQYASASVAYSQPQPSRNPLYANQRSNDSVPNYSDVGLNYDNHEDTREYQSVRGNQRREEYR